MLNNTDQLKTNKINQTGLKGPATTYKIMTTIYNGTIAQNVCNAILSAHKEGSSYNTPIPGYDHLSAGYWKEGNKWIAYDNTTEDCWIEEFDTRKDAVAYCNI